MRNFKGIVIPLFAVFLTVAIGLGAMVLDIGQEYSIKTRIQNALDLATLAGASQIEEDSSISNIKNTALNYLNNNLNMTLPSFSNLTLDSTDLSIQIGVYDFDNMTFTENESLDSANAIMVFYTYESMTFLAPIFMIDNIQISDDAIAVKQAAGSMPPGTGFPLGINTSQLSVALNNANMLDLYQSGASENSYWTKYTANAPSVQDIRDILDYFQYGTGNPPSGISINQEIAYSNSAMTALYNDMEPGILVGMTYVFPVVSITMADTIAADGFVGATINSIVDVMGDNYISITIDPKYVENNYGGLGVGSSSPNIGEEEEELLANSFGLIQ